MFTIKRYRKRGEREKRWKPKRCFLFLCRPFLFDLYTYLKVCLFMHINRRGKKRETTSRDMCHSIHVKDECTERDDACMSLILYTNSEIHMLHQLIESKIDFFFFK